MSTRVEGPAPSEPTRTRVEGRLIQVAVPVPQIGPLTYSVPDEFPDPPVGVRVLVPVGKRVLTGIVLTAPDSQFAVRDSRLAKSAPTQQWLSSPESTDVEPDDNANREPRTANRENVKPIIDLLDVTPFLPSDVVTLAMWVSEYYACGPGEAIAAAMPPRAWIESERHAQITSAGRAQLAAERGARRELLAALDVVHPVRVETLVGKTARHATLLALERDGLIEITHPLRGHASAYRTARFATLTTHA